MGLGLGALPRPHQGRAQVRLDVGVPRALRQDLPEQGDRLVGPPLPEARHPQAVPGRAELGVQAERLLEVRGRLLGTAVLQEDRPETGVGGGRSRIDAEGRLEGGLGLVGLPRVQKGGPEVQAGLHEVRPQLHGAAHVLDGPGHVPRPQREAQVGVGQRGAGVELERALQLRDRLVQLPHLRQRHAQVRPGLGVAGADRQGRAGTGDGLLQRSSFSVTRPTLVSAT
jgi:hypothetical protein